MPLFIFLSGYFSRKKDKKDLWKSIWKILEPLAIFQVLTIIPTYIIRGFSFGAILTPWYVLWYLLSLIYWRLLIQIIPEKILNNATLILIITFFISILAGFIPIGGFLAIQRTLSFMPFFFLGYYMKRKNIYLPDRYKPLSFLLLISVIAVPLYFYQFLGDLCHADPYNSAYDTLSRLFIFILAIPMSVAFLNVCPNKAWTARQGKLTLQYYIYHALMITPIVTLVNQLNIPISLVSTIIISLTITVLIGIVSHLSIFNKITNPSIFFLN